MSSAGVGRTGTFVVIDMMLDRMSKEGTLDIKGTVEQLRSKRMHMVQTLVRCRVIYVLYYPSTAIYIDEYITLCICGMLHWQIREQSVHTSLCHCTFVIVIEICQLIA